MQIISAVFAGSVISQGFGKLVAIIEYQFSLTIYPLDPTHFLSLVADHRIPSRELELLLLEASHIK